MLRSLQLTVLLLELLLATPAEPQNLRKPMCPVRNMDVEDNINASILDDHFVYACEMVGHIDERSATVLPGHLACHVVKTGDALMELTPDCLARKKPWLHVQLELDQSLVDFVLWCEVHQISISGHMLIAQARRLAERHHILSCSLPRFGLSWLRRFQERYGIKWKRARGKSGSVDMQTAAAEVHDCV
ncbi:hypothetical protein PF010_g19003 [Phytophthora fragariae]|uniref:HTH CENPB-type domain-containing protein n=1 Tax=Phytophthora fragariae TaxID=53985 RepID=A0A6G0KJ38_9STRA|nr:hypothetical protein PF010_g19003 [Phytophthora fragariae]